MVAPDLPEIPVPLKSIQHYLKVASEHDQRDPVVSYWARLYALQAGLKLSTKTAAENNFLLKLMDWLETTKKSLIDNEAITNEVAAQAHLENWALKLFLYADKNDREGTFNKSVIQGFYTAGLLYDVLTTFGELTEEAVQNRKYAKWKAAYIHNCLKNGETPVPGPMKEEGEEDDNSNIEAGPGPDEDLVPDIEADSEPAEVDNGEEDNEANEPANEPEGESATPEQADEALSEPGIDPADEALSESGVDPEPGIDPADEAVSEPGVDPADEAPSEPGIDPADEAVSEPGVDPADEAPSEPGIDLADEAVSEPGVDPADEPPSEPGIDLADEAPSEPGVDPADETPSEPGKEPASVDEDMEAPQQPTPPPSTDAYGFPSVPDSATPQAPGNTRYPNLPNPVTPNPYNPAPTPTSPTGPTDFSSTPKLTGEATLSAEQMNKVSKYIKWAGSAITYDDVPTTIDNLQKALHLLTTGQDS